MRTLYGFTLSFSNGKNALEYTINTDDFSVRKYEDENVFVVTQTSWKKTDAAADIALDYCKCGCNNWTPSRYTNGSFALVDKKNGEIYVGRDRTYASHLYYFFDGEQHHYTTDDAQLVNYTKVLDAEAVDMMLMNNIKVMAALPLFKGSKAVLPGHFLHHVLPYIGVGHEGVFWRIEPCMIPSNYDKAIERYGDLLVDSINNNIENDEVAVWLSGGSDSAAIMGALHRMNVKNVQAAHMYYKGNFDFEHDDVNTLRDAFGFNLKNVTPDVRSEEWRKYVDHSLLNVTLNSLGISIPSHVLSGSYLGTVVDKGSTAMIGEFCLLDSGFSEQNDKTRNFRRWLYRGGGRYFAKGLKVLPDGCFVDWEKYRGVHPKGRVEKLNYRFRILQSLLYSTGRPGLWYGGMKIGMKGGLYPIPDFTTSFLSKDYETHIWDRLYKGVFSEFEEALKTNKWTAAIDTMLSNWYSEFSNTSMANDSCALSGMQYCLPFSSVDFLDFQSSLPEKWKIDKKIQKDMCHRFLNMPEEVAYRNKNHSRSVPYEQIVYPYMQSVEWNKNFLERIYSTDFGPLTDGIRKDGDYMWFNRKFALHAIMLWMNKYGLKIE